MFGFKYEFEGEFAILTLLRESIDELFGTFWRACHHH